MTERVRFLFDPICPWCYQTSRWAKRLEELGELQLSWGLFSLEAQNAGKEAEDLAEMHSRSMPALRVSASLRGREGDGAVGAFYAALGVRFFERAEPLEETETLRGALADARLGTEHADAALADEATMRAVIDDHRRAVERHGAFGVPTIVLDDGAGPAIFGPVLREVPADDEAVELFRHVVWLSRYENFAELKRERTDLPDLEVVRRWRARQPV